MRAEYIDHMGDDLRVVNAARVSFNKESCWEESKEFYEVLESGDCIPASYLREKDKKLIDYLAKHGHFTPFTHATITLRETVPIFVARQRFKHTVGFSYNEVSRRYVDDDPEFYVPDVWRSRPDGSVKQGSGSEWALPYFWTEDKEGVDTPIEDVYEWWIHQATCLYRDMVEKGVAPEQARMVLPQSMYTSYYVTGSLAAFARAYNLRAEDHAQKEIQDLASQWKEIINPLFPVSWRALTYEET